MDNQVCIVIPIYKRKLNKYERLSISLVREKFRCYDIYFIAHKRLDMKDYLKYDDIKTVYFPERYFKNIISYSRLLINERFYRKFKDYEYMLIVQPDALIFGDAVRLKWFMDQGYDYWGARWIQPVEICSFEIEKNVKKKFTARIPPDFERYIFRNPRYCSVGNGGLSLRNIRKTIALIKEKKCFAIVWWDNEDKFFAYHGMKNNVNYRIVPEKLADKFSLESNISLLNEIRPFGIHGWERLGKSTVLRYLREQKLL